MKTKLENQTLTLYFEGRIDSSNVDGISQEADGIIAENKFANLVIDADKLEYVSSAGLRMILKLRKAYSTLKIINANSDVYDIFEMTGFTEMITVEKAFKVLSVDGCKVIGQGAKGVVYRYDDETIVKVYKSADSLPDIQRERELARRAFVLGIPTAISYNVVKVGESFGSVFELLNAKSYSQLIFEDQANRDKYIDEYALLLKKIHSTTVSANDMPDNKPVVKKWLVDSKPFLDQADYDKLENLIDSLPDTMNMLHCDYHTNNVLSQNNEALLIDMDTLCHGHPIFELANVYITYVGFAEEDQMDVEKFLGMPKSLAKYVWQRFLPTYLGTDDQNKICDVESKAILLSCLRFIRHVARRNQQTTEKGKATIDHCVAKVHDILQQTDTLEF